MENSKIIILIPSHNELKTLKKICIYIKKNNFKFLIIDDSSQDGTSRWLKKNKFNYLRNKTQMGYERSIIRGIKKIVKKKNIKYLITFDADGEHQTKDIKRIIKFIKDEKISLLICNRDKLNRLTEYLISFLFFKKFEIKDPLSGFRAYSIRELRHLSNNIKNNEFLIDLVLSFKKKKLNIKNMPIQTKRRLGKPRVGNILFVNSKILKLIKYIFPLQKHVY